MFFDGFLLFFAVCCQIRFGSLTLINYDKIIA